MVKSGSFQVGQGSLGARLGTGIGKGLGEQIPKEVERQRLKTGLEEFAREAPGLDPLQAAAKYLSIHGLSPQAQQILPELVRQQSLINRYNETKNKESPSVNVDIKLQKELEPGYRTATTPESTKSVLNPYIPLSGPEQERLARRLMAEETNAYPTIESARAAVASQNAANIQQSNALIQKAQLEEGVQEKTEQKLRNEISTLGANVPGTVISRLQQKAVDKVASGELSADKAKVEIGKDAQNASQDFSNIRSWGGIGLITNSVKGLNTATKTLQKNAKKGGYQKEAADSMIADNLVTPEFAYARMYPVSDIESLNNDLKKLPDISVKTEKVIGLPGLAGLGRSNTSNNKQKTLEIAPRLARSMGLEGSPLAIAYELEKKGYDPQVWKDYLIENNINLSDHQRDELQKTQPSFFGKLNDWFFRSFTGVE